MLSDQDQKFYFKLMLYLLVLAIGVRCYLWFAEVDFEIPVVDDVLIAAWRVIGAALKGFSKMISPT